MELYAIFIVHLPRQKEGEGGIEARAEVLNKPLMLPLWCVMLGWSVTTTVQSLNFP